MTGVGGRECDRVTIRTGRTSHGGEPNAAAARGFHRVGRKVQQNPSQGRYIALQHGEIINLNHDLGPVAPRGWPDHIANLR